MNTSKQSENRLTAQFGDVLIGPDFKNSRFADERRQNQMGVFLLIFPTIIFAKSTMLSLAGAVKPIYSPPPRRSSSRPAS